MSTDAEDDAAVRAVIEESQRQIEAAAREASRLEAKWDGYCGLVQACEEDEGWGDVLRHQNQEQQEEIDFSPQALSRLRARLEALRCSAVAAAVAPARAVGREKKTEPEASDPAAANASAAATAAAAVATSDAAYAAAIERVKAGDMPGAAERLRDALFVEQRPRARERIEKYLRAVEAKIL